jgi:hypothetical protein
VVSPANPRTACLRRRRSARIQNAIDPITGSAYLDGAELPHGYLVPVESPRHLVGAFDAEVAMFERAIFVTQQGSKLLRWAAVEAIAP